MRSRSFQIAHRHGRVALLLALAACSRDTISAPTRAAAVTASAKHGYVDHNRYDTASILALIEHRWQLAPLAARDAAANDMRNAFDFAQGLGESRVP